MDKFQIVSIIACFILAISIFAGLRIIDERTRPRKYLEEGIYINGEIYAIEGNRILVAEGITREEFTGDINELVGNAIWLNIDENTRIIKNNQNSSFEELELYDSVNVWTEGIILESYPARGTASKIQIIPH